MGFGSLQSPVITSCKLWMVIYSVTFLVENYPSTRVPVMVLVGYALDVFLRGTAEEQVNPPGLES